MTPLDDALLHGSSRSVKYLIRHGALKGNQVQSRLRPLRRQLSEIFGKLRRSSWQGSSASHWGFGFGRVSREHYLRRGSKRSSKDKKASPTTNGPSPHKV